MGKKCIIFSPNNNPEKANRKSLCRPGKRKHETENRVQTLIYAKGVFTAHHILGQFIHVKTFGGFRPKTLVRNNRAHAWIILHLLWRPSMQ